MTERSRCTRRDAVAAGVALAGGLAGCTNVFRGDADPSTPTLADFRGDTSVSTERPVPDAPRIASLPDLDGRLTIYVGGTAGGRYDRLVSLLERTYPEFDPTLRVEPPTVLARALRDQAAAGNVRADVFLSTDAGAVDALADAGLTAALPARITSAVPARFSPTDTWVGVAAHSRGLAYDASILAREDVPRSIGSVPTAESTPIAWGPRTAGFRTFVTALRALAGETTARSWLDAMLDADTVTVDDEFFAAHAVGRGRALLGLVNHQDVLRVLAGRPDSPVAVAFTRTDAGALVNATAAAVLRASNSPGLAATFVRHLLTAEAQEFAATDALAYPLVDGVSPVDALPPLDSLQPPALSLGALGDLRPTTRLLRDVGVLP